MPTDKKLNTDMTMQEIMDRWPATINVILHRRMLCVGCPISKFHTLVDAAREHSVDQEEFEVELRAAIALSKTGVKKN
jgi:hybrid cluster-associated redox disulfide protein